MIATAARPAAAQEQPRVYILAVPMDDSLDAIATRVGSASRAALRGIEGVDWRTPDQRFLGYDDSALSLIDRARQQLDAGRDAYLNLEFDTAIEQLTGAVENFDAAAAALEDPEDLGQALLFLGASHGFNEQRREAIEVFRRLHIQMPHIEPDPDTFPPDVVRLYTQARPRDARNPRGSIVIDSNPTGAIAYVDFLARGRTPLTVDGLMSGEHVVRVTRPGAIPFAEALDVRGRQPAGSNAFLVDQDDLQGLSESIAEARGASVDSLQDSPIAQVASMLQVDKIGVIRVSGGQDQVSLELLLFDVASGRRLVRGEGSASTEVGVLEASVQRAVSGAFEAALRPSQAGDSESIPAMATGERPGDTGATEDPGPSVPVYEEWWFWTIIGVVVLGGVAAAIAGGIAAQGPALGQDRGGQVVFTF